MCEKSTFLANGSMEGERTNLAGSASRGDLTGPSDEVVEATVRIPSEDGVADAFFAHPAKGKHPGVLMWPDIAGLRGAMKVMARRMAKEGYAVLAVNQYYRNGTAPILHKFSEWLTPEGQQKVRPMVAPLTHEAISRDAKAFIAHLDAQETVDKSRKIGTQGYCLGGIFVVRTALAVPARVGAAVSCHGAFLVTAAPDSPHRILGQSKASFLFAIAQNDHRKAPGDKEELRKSAHAAGCAAEIEVYPADHGWCVLDAPAYDEVQAERTWDRMLALYRSTL